MYFFCFFGHFVLEEAFTDGPRIFVFVALAGRKPPDGVRPCVMYKMAFLCPFSVNPVVLRTSLMACKVPPWCQRRWRLSGGGITRACCMYHSVRKNVMTVLGHQYVCPAFLTFPNRVVFVKENNPRRPSKDCELFFLRTLYISSSTMNIL